MTFLNSLPNGLAAALVLAVGALGALASRTLVVRLLQLLRLNRLCERFGADEFLRKGGVTFTPAELAGRGLAWLILIAALLEAAKILDIAALSELRQRAIAALPSVISGCLVLAVGLMIVSFLAGFLRTVARYAGNPFDALWSRIARGIGTFLLDYLIMIAHERGIQKLSANILYENSRMIRVFDKARVKPVTSFDSGIVVKLFHLNELDTEGNSNEK
jgi:hypothetical protein